MIIVSDVMCEKAELPKGATADDLLGKLRTQYSDILDGLLASEQTVTAATDSLAQLASYKLRVVRQTGIAQEKFCSVMVETHNVPVLVGLISNEPARNLPTSLENLVFWALLNPDLGWDKSWQDSGAGSVSNWRTLAKGMAIIAEPLDFKADGRRLISALFSLADPDIAISAMPPAIVSSSTSISIDAPPCDFTLVQARLLFEAASVTHPKWRCLSLYRILENAYLTNIKKALLLDFDLDAGKAIESAKKKVGSELNQLVYLAEQANLTAEFVAFNDEVELLLGQANQFIIKLDKGAEEEELYKSKEIFKKAVLRFYKLRCSIAHAGTSSVIYEQFPDANAATLALLPAIESIVLKSLNITVGHV